MLGLREEFDYRICTDCAALQIASLPADLERFYPSDYYTAVERAPIVTGGWARRRWSGFRLRQGRWVRWISGRRYGRFDWLRRTRTRLDDAILDVGCGSGRLLRRLARDGFTHLVGIDARWSGPPERGKSVCIERATPETHVGRYRLVMAHHSLEHMAEPGRAVEAMAGLVEPGGHLLLRVPLAEGAAFAEYGADWVQLDAPRHLGLPTRRAIHALAARAGLRVVAVVDDSGPFQFWGSEVYRRGGSLRSAGRGGRRVLCLPARLLARVRAIRVRHRGEGDQACFYLQKPESRGEGVT